MVERWLGGGDRTANNCIAMFCALLGNLALLLGATGGVYIGGGIVPRLGDAFASSPFASVSRPKGGFVPICRTFQRCSSRRRHRPRSPVLPGHWISVPLQ